jgi:hypothetical protein
MSGKLLLTFFLIGLSKCCDIEELKPQLSVKSVTKNEIELEWTKPNKTIGTVERTEVRIDPISMNNFESFEVKYEASKVNFGNLNSGENYTFVAISHDDEGFEYYSEIVEAKTNLKFPEVEKISIIETSLPPLNNDAYLVTANLSFSIPRNIVSHVQEIRISYGSEQRKIVARDIKSENELEIEFREPNEDYIIRIELFSGDRKLHSQTIRSYRSPPGCEYFKYTKYRLPLE